MNKQKLFKMFADLIYDYKSVEENIIWETSGNIERAEKELEREVAERIENFKAELDSSEWIPCSEMLPEDTKTKIITLSDGSVESGYYSEENWWCVGDSINLEIKKDVIAWMPLPEPYEVSN